ncbi:MAG: hypothetical protein K2H99_04725, partial [Paramuribaculum sp.]|nr:hypothetical protein [Paramuribaculum sp.]
SYNNGAQYTRTATVTDGTYEFNNGDNTIKRATIEITLPENYPGENADIVLGLKKDGLYPWNHTGTGSYKFTAITASSSSSSNINKLREPFGISAIDIEYYGDDELPKYIRTVTCGIDNNDIVEVEQNGSFVDITDATIPASLSDATVKIRIGDAIVEITKSTTNNTSKPTVTFDKTRMRVGVHAYATIKAYPDPEKYKYNGTAAKPYQMTYMVHGLTPANKYTYAADESAKNMGVNSTLLKEKGITYTPIKKDPDILSISTTAGIPNDVTLTVQSDGTWGAPDDPNENPSIRVPSVKSGTYPAFVFDGISFIVPSDTPNPPLKPTAKTDLDDAALSGGVWNSARPFTLTLAPQTDDYDNHKIEYIISETPVDELDWTSAKEYTTPLSIEKSCYVYARILSTYEGKTYPSAVETVVASILNPIKIADLADLHKAENDGKVVLLQMPLMVRGNCKMNVQGADAAKKFTNVVYARDVNGIAVKLISRRNKSEETA